MPICEGTGEEANRAVEAARGTGLPVERPLKEPDGLPEVMGTGCGRDDEPLPGEDMLVLISEMMMGSRERTRVVQMLSWDRS